MSIVTSYLRIWSGKRFKLLCHAFLCVISIFGLTLFLGGIFACVPVSLSWAPPPPSGPDSRDPRRRCMDLPLFMFATSILNTAIDLAILAIPAPLFRKLQIAPKQRAALTAVFAIGVVVCVASVMRLVTLQHVRRTEDPSVSGLPLGIWSGVELDLGIICACLPTLRPMLARVFPRLLGSTVDSELSWRGTQRITRDGNGSYRMHELHSDDEDGKLGNNDAGTRISNGTSAFPRAPAPLHLDKYNKFNKSYMDFD
ncbi:integral membrane protein [Daldinia childiae]|uniref:uncharacterized protein n=1 Tax=Daldinia childiae TaxID=326645 RepID=UPI00144664E9|nr:uncharacterized protein GL218_08230 [Daldinia childiae]KAF3069124.1 integral membrane protein [Daldinia childiae]